MMEPTAVASWRNLPSVHPVWKLLYPHTKGIMAINTLGRNELISEGGVADKVLSIGGGGHVTLMQKHYRSVTFDSYYIVDALKDRGVSELRKFYYKDDATLLWNAIQGFVGDIIDIYYTKDKDVQQVSICISSIFYFCYGSFLSIKIIMFMQSVVAVNFKLRTCLTCFT